VIFTPLTIAFAFVAIVLALGYAVYAEMSAQAIDTYVTPPHHEARLIELDREAIEAAYRQHVQSVFATWMKDDTGQPGRAVRGVRIARKAYVDSMINIEERAAKVSK
jgi:hypothetical protein